MRTIIVALSILYLAFTPVFGYDDCSDEHRNKSHRINVSVDFLDDVDIDIDDGTIIMTHKGRSRDRVEITANYELYIDGHLIVTDEEQKELLGDYYELTVDLVEFAKEIGYEGAKIGVSGAAIGLRAIGGVFRALLTEYEFEELEDDLDEEAEELEAKAEKLERKAEKLEDIADELADVHDDLRRETPELRDLDWF